MQRKTMLICSKCKNYISNTYNGPLIKIRPVLRIYYYNAYIVITRINYNGWDFYTLLPRVAANAAVRGLLCVLSAPATLTFVPFRRANILLHLPSLNLNTIALPSGASSYRRYLILLLRRRRLIESCPTVA